MTVRGVVAAGHPLTAKTGADVLRAGGNAVDAAVAAVLASCVTEPLLTGLGASGYMLISPPDQEPVLLDFSAEAPGRGIDVASRAPLVPFVVNFGDADQTFHVGASSCAVYGVPAGVEAAAKMFGSTPLHELVRPAVRLAREGVRVNKQQAYVFSLIGSIVGRSPVEGDLLHEHELAETLARLGNDGAEPFYTGDIGHAIADEVLEHGGMITRADLEAYRVVPRTPMKVTYRGRDVFTNPPPSAGGDLLAHALEMLPERPGPTALAKAMVAATVNRLGSTTHISVLDAQGMACTVTCTNGEGSGVAVRGTGVHLNNMMGEEDLSPAGFFTHLPGDRLPSMMAPTVVTRDGQPELVLGSAGSSRIFGAILQVIVNVIDHGMRVQDAVDAPRLHAQGDLVFVEPGVDVTGLGAVQRFRAPNMFFGGCQAVERVWSTGELIGGGDHRRGGVAVTA